MNNELTKLILKAALNALVVDGNCIAFVVGISVLIVGVVRVVVDTFFFSRMMTLIPAYITY